MRHGASLISALEGMSRPVYHIARELAQNSRAGLTVRFLSKKLELPEEEIEYIIDVNHRLFFFDLTKVKLVVEGGNVVKRITEGLENRGDIPSMFRLVKSLSTAEFRALEEQVGLDNPGAKKGAVEELIERYFKHPDSVVEYVASRGFSPTAREVFDIVWQSKEGLMPVSKIRAAHGGTEFEVEQALYELFRGFALFEMFRFDAEERLVRVAGVLSETRQWHEEMRNRKKAKTPLKTRRNAPGLVESRGVEFADRICRLVAAIAAKPARLRGDGELFREDRRRLGEICAEEYEPSLDTCLWVAQGVGWLARVDDELRAGKLDALLSTERVARQRVLADWLLSSGGEGAARRTMVSMLEEMRTDEWYPVTPFVRHATRAMAGMEEPVLKCMGGHWRYVSPSTSPNAERVLARALEENLFWLGIVDRADDGADNLFRVTELGEALLTGKDDGALAGALPVPINEIVVQPNFDIVVPSQDIDPLLTVPLEQFALRSSVGQATVYHLNKESFTKGVQDGHDAGAFVKFLLDHNRGGELPSNVLSTLKDWSGGMKQVRLRTLHVLESDDPLVIADLLHRRRFKKNFCTIDAHTTITYTDIAKAELTKELEKDGFVVN